MSTQRYVTTIKAGADLIQTLSESLYKNAYYVLDELISNSYDADATEVSVQISQDKLSIIDNGSGMDRIGLDNYLFLGSSEKREERKSGKFMRNTIGKFGIGKLSMRVICDKCKIVTVKNGIQLSLILDFDKILAHKGIEDEQIQVTECSTGGSSGTSIELLGLKKTLDEKNSKRRIAKNMPLSPDFQVLINNELLKPEDIIKGREYLVDLNLPITGRVTGKIILSESTLGDFSGVYIKVFGRTVNADDPNIFDLARIVTGFLSFVNRCYCVLNADGLDDIVLATRNGFSVESPKFLEFREAVIKKIKEITKEVQTSQVKEVLDYERNLLEDVIREQVDRMMLGADIPEDFFARTSRRTDAKQAMSSIKTIEENRAKRETQIENKGKTIKPQEPRLIKIGKKRYRFELEPMGKQAYECILDAQKAIFYINTEHPQYIYSRSEDSLAHHFRRVIVFEIARAISGNLDEFLQQYAGMMLQEIKVGEKNPKSL